MKNARYCIVLAAVVLVSCQRAPASHETSDGSSAAPAAGQPSSQEIPANTVFWVRLGKDLDTTRLKAGDHFSAEVSSPVVLNGKAAIPERTPVQGDVVEAQTATHQGSSGRLTLKLTSFRLGLRSFPIQTEVLTLQSPAVQTADSGSVARHEGDAFAPKNENLQFIISAPVSLR